MTQRHFYPLSSELEPFLFRPTSAISYDDLGDVAFTLAFNPTTFTMLPRAVIVANIVANYHG